MDLKLTGGKLTPNVMFTMGSTEVKTTVTYVAVDGLKIEMKYEFDLGGARLESTAHAAIRSKARTPPSPSRTDRGWMMASGKPNGASAS